MTEEIREAFQYAAEAVRRWPTSQQPARPLNQRVVVAGAAYMVVAVFFAAFLGLRRYLTDLTSTEALILSAVTAMPPALALLWERLKGFKTGPIEISLGEVTANITVELGTAIQAQKSSETLALISADRCDG